MMTPEQLEGIQADVEDAEKRAGRIATWRAMPHRFAVESGLRTQGLRAPRLAAHLRDLLAEVGRLQAEVERLRPRPSFCLQCLYDLAGSDCCPECGAEVQDSSDGYQDAYRAGQEDMRYRCASHVADNADGACNCGGTILCRPDCARVRLLDLADAIRALEVER